MPNRDEASGGVEVVPVLIVGAGPVGLALACSLRRLGVSCRVVDSGAGPTPEGESRALGLQARTMEIFEALGVADTLVAGGLEIRGLVAWRGRRPRFRLDASPLEGETRYPFILSIPQGATERALIDRLEALGGRVEWGTRLSGLGQDGGGVDAGLTADDGRIEKARAGWLVGCDGARSTVREALGLRFEGTSNPERFLLADVEIDWDLPRDHGHLMLTPEGVVPALPMPRERAWRLIDTTARLDSDEPAAIVGRFDDLLRRYSPVPATSMGPATWTSAFRIHRRAVGRLRIGRCLVAGDAAHIHSPVGGQGLNTGVQDAFNLSWKLALVARGEAPDTLLDSYDAERRPVAEAVLAATDRATRVVTLRNPLARWARDSAVATLVRIPPLHRRLIRSVADLEVTYRGGPLSIEEWPPHPLDRGDGPRPGDRLPDLPSGASGGLLDHARGPWFTLFLLPGIEPPSAAAGESIRAVLDLAAGRFGEIVRVVPVVGPGGMPDDAVPTPSSSIEDPDGRIHRLLGCPGPGLLLVRPDGHLGFRCRPPDAGRLRGYLDRCLGLGAEVGG
ncbi:FAD-dependent monooxygenase [Tautonia plasticadhaerens]|uniref:Pentachlorophenol 4-monooxygenase n=1 Tax=Tautonia plasticadhaerens TaxID=2527974 RepID=A0A518HAV3_9BACT|nr:FAD-dependent monooxygenase [Tautonia plasticadhaerens]QDV37988.1 Pentachlorophenol 4-monooxygenase [Tautonia plasticadhaerens]